MANNSDTLSCYECQKPTPVAEGALCSDCRHGAEAMTTCPDCTEKVSQRAPTCVHCGAQLNHRSDPRPGPAGSPGEGTGASLTNRTPPLSPDGKAYWDGETWVAKPSGKVEWNGTDWLPYPDDGKHYTWTGTGWKRTMSVRAKRGAVIATAVTLIVLVASVGTWVALRPPPPPTAVTATIDVGDRPLPSGVLPDGSAVYVPNSLDDSVSVIDTESNAVTTIIGVGRAPGSPGVLPDSSAVYVPNDYGGTVSVIDTVSNAVTETITVGGAPGSPGMLPDGSAVYVPNYGSGTVSVIDTVSNAVTTTIDVV
jgi:YVTN family beta-propeller protein